MKTSRPGAPSASSARTRRLASRVGYLSRVAHHDQSDDALAARDLARVAHRASRALDELDELAVLTRNVAVPVPATTISELLAAIERVGD